MGTIIAIVCTTLPALCGATLGALLGHCYTMRRYKKEKEAAIEENLEPLLHVLHWNLLTIKKIFEKLKDIEITCIEDCERVKQSYENAICNAEWNLLDCESVWTNLEAVLFTYLRKECNAYTPQQINEILSDTKILITQLQRFSKYQKDKQSLWEDAVSKQEKFCKNSGSHPSRRDIIKALACDDSMVISTSWNEFDELLLQENKLFSYELKLFSYIKNNCAAQQITE